MNRDIALTVFESSSAPSNPPPAATPTKPPESNPAAEAAKIKYVLRFGNRSWAISLVIAITLGLSILGFVYNYFGVVWYTKFYIPCLGYNILASIYASHFWPNAPSPMKKPTLLGAERYVLVFVAMLGLFFIHEVIMRSFLDTAAKVMTGHITFILIGFFFGAWEDVCFDGKLLAWLGVFRGVGWYVVTWGSWCLLLLGITGIRRDHFDGIFVNWALCWIQMAIVTQLWLGIWFSKDLLLKFKPIPLLVRGLVLTGIIFTNGVAVSHIVYGFTALYCEECKPGDMWHFGVACASYPLMPIITMGLYGNAFREFTNPVVRVVSAWAFVQVVSVADFFLFHLLFSPMHIMGHATSWFHDTELIVNFTIAYIMLTWHWFTQRWGFMKAVLPPSVELVTVPPGSAGTAAAAATTTSNGAAALTTSTSASTTPSDSSLEDEVFKDYNSNIDVNIKNSANSGHSHSKKHARSYSSSSSSSSSAKRTRKTRRDEEDPEAENDGREKKQQRRHHRRRGNGEENDA
ncbi:hypothetical protein Pelo_2243 [Pelomyxa schiedti]|nr:hypothetical protein Pelo_2243 [Pelomyxa schiedti]